VDSKKIQRLYDTFDVIHTRPLKVRDRQTGEFRQIGELSYITARQVMDRLDEVFGVFGWQVKFEAMDPRNVKCSLSVNVDGEWITKEDFGFSDNENSADSGIKGAASDALKRAAVHFGIGRFLYDERSGGDNGNRGGGGGYGGNSGGYGRQQGYQRRENYGGAQRSRSFGNRSENTDTNTGEVYEKQPFKKPFGSEDPVEKTIDLLSANSFTPEEFHEAFGVNFSPLIIANLLEEGWTPESIVGAVKKAASSK
jgi:hypothetical protein